VREVIKKAAPKQGADFVEKISKLPGQFVVELDEVAVTLIALYAYLFPSYTCVPADDLVKHSLIGRVTVLERKDRESAWGATMLTCEHFVDLGFKTDYCTEFGGCEFQGGFWRKSHIFLIG
jgi:hypothetical protein